MQPPPPEQLVCIRSVTKFRNFTMEDSKVKLAMVFQGQSRDFSVSLIFECDITDVGQFRRVSSSCDARR